MSVQQKWLTIVGIEETGLSGLSDEARIAIESADVVFGGARHLAMIAELDVEKCQWQSPFACSLDEIAKRRGDNVVVLATGDPQWFGVGNVLCGKFPVDELTIIPARPVFSLAAGRLGWSLSKVQMLSLHGRDFDNIARYIIPRSQLLILTSDGTTPSRIAEYLVECGFGDSQIWVMEHLGGKNERVHLVQADRFELDNVADLNIVAVACRAGNEARWHSPASGLSDDAYDHDGQLTKNIVRAATLAALRPFPGGILWDVGAGSGSIGIEWMRVAENTTAIAVEVRKDRIDRIKSNAARLGVPGLKIVEGRAPECLQDLPAPDAIFIGGGLTGEGVFDACWESLPAGGVLVANGVTLESEAMLIELNGRLGGELSRISVETSKAMGGFRGWQPSKPVIQWRLVKPGNGQ